MGWGAAFSSNCNQPTSTNQCQPPQKRDESNKEVLRLRKQLDYWKEQAGLVTAEARSAADLREVVDRRTTPGPDDDGAPTPPPHGAAASLGGSATAAALAARQRAGAGGGTDAGSSVCGGGGVGSVGGWSEAEGGAASEQD
jgi:hypothetical protein